MVPCCLSSRGLWGLCAVSEMAAGGEGGRVDFVVRARSGGDSVLSGSRKVTGVVYGAWGGASGGGWGLWRPVRALGITAMD